MDDKEIRFAPKYYEEFEQLTNVGSFVRDGHWAEGSLLVAKMWDFDKGEPLGPSFTRRVAKVEQVSNAMSRITLEPA